MFCLIYLSSHEDRVPFPNNGYSYRSFPPQEKTELFPQIYHPHWLGHCVSRLLKRLVKERVARCLPSDEPIDGEKRGILQSSSCATRHFDCINFVKEVADKSKLPLIIFLDKTKAFDHAPGNDLFSTFCSQRITGWLRAWFSPYLSIRFQSVPVDGHHSCPTSITTGVLGRGSAKLLYFPCLNDIAHLLWYDITFLFANEVKNG